MSTMHVKIEDLSQDLGRVRYTMKNLNNKTTLRGQGF
jgi:hypothetical protein